MIWVTATNGASSRTYSPDSAPKDRIKSSTLWMGFRCAITRSEARTATPPNRRNSVISQSERQHERSRRDQIQDGRRQENLPAEPHQLVVPVPRERPAHPDVEEQNRADLDQEPDPAERHGKKRTVPPTEKQVGCNRRDGHHVDVLRQKEHGEAHGAVLRVVSGDQLLLGLRKVEGRAIGLGDARRQ